jgi:ATP-dependent Clp protease adaptor protein ClpS
MSGQVAASSYGSYGKAWSRPMGEYIPSPTERVRTKPKQEVKRPPLYKVLLHNDHYTTMDFVVYVLTSIFRKHTEEAVRIMLHVHKRGVGMAGVYPAEVAETKINAVHELAQENGFPLKCSMEPE